MLVDGGRRALLRLVAVLACAAAVLAAWIGATLMIAPSAHAYDSAFASTTAFASVALAPLHVYDPLPDLSRQAAGGLPVAAEGTARGLGELAPIAGGAPGAMFENAGIDVSEHFLQRLAQREASGRLTETEALDAYRNGRLYYDEAYGTYIRYSSRTQVAVATDAPTGGQALTVFEGPPSPRWNPIQWRPGQ